MESRELLRAWAIIALAGRVAEVRALRGSSPGWRRQRTPEERIAYHEAGHAAAVRAFGFTVIAATVIPDLGQLVGNGHAGGMVVYGVSDSCTRPAETGAILPDHRQAARLAWALAGGGWQGTLQYVRELRAETGRMIEGAWPEVLTLAGELLRRGELGGTEILALLPGVSKSAAA